MLSLMRFALVTLLVVGCYRSHGIGARLDASEPMDAPIDVHLDAPEGPDAPDARADVPPDVGVVLGCADGTREGLTDALRYPAVAACAGVFMGWIDEGSADAICSPGWHVCRGNDAAVNALAADEASAFAGCFGYDAAQDCGACFPSCRGAMGSCMACCVSATDPTDPDMAGLGAGCNFVGEGPACLSDLRLDASTNTFGCGYDPSLRGVVCCAD